MKAWAESFYKSTVWQKTRDAYLQSVSGLCERCAAKDEFVPAEIVHHRIWLTRATINDPSVSLAWDNLEALCQKCHNQEHFSEKFDKRFMFSADGRIFPLPPSADEA